MDIEEAYAKIAELEATNVQYELRFEAFRVVINKLATRIVVLENGKTGGEAPMPDFLKDLIYGKKK